MFTIIRFTFNPDTQDYDSEQSQSDYGIRGIFDEDKERVFYWTVNPSYHIKRDQSGRYITIYKTRSKARIKP